MRVKFAGDDGFHSDLKARVAAHFERTGVSQHGDARMYWKTATILAWCALSYALLVFVADSWWQGILCSFSLGLAISGVGFSVQHDANHGAYSQSEWVNRLMGKTFDMLGASSYVWRWKHNVFHHTYTNLAGADADLDVGPFGRLAPGQPRYWIHRFQRFYMWGLYGFLLPKWHFVDDFKDVITARIANNRFPRPRGLSLAMMILGKVFFVFWAIVLPLMLHRWWVVGLFYAFTWGFVGLLVSVVFQLAHCLEEASFPGAVSGGDGESRSDDGWAVHQLKTTIDFARDNRVLTWYLGGLNFQVEHHLFPKICHLHYPALSRIVEETCRDHGVRYVAHDQFFGAVLSHWRWLGKMGQPATTVP